jgi:hypothetical protein
VSVLLNNGDGTFAAKVDSMIDGKAASVTVADMNGDGKLDLAVNGGEGTVSVLLNNGDGTFSAATEYLTDWGGGPSIVAANLNGDGRPDLAVANGQGLPVSVLLNVCLP